MIDAEIILGVGLLSLILGVFGFALRSMPWEVAHRIDLRQLSMQGAVRREGASVLIHRKNTERGDTMVKFFFLRACSSAGFLLCGETAYAEPQN